MRQCAIAQSQRSCSLQHLINHILEQSLYEQQNARCSWIIVGREKCGVDRGICSLTHPLDLRRSLDPWPGTLLVRYKLFTSPASAPRKRKYWDEFPFLVPDWCPLLFFHHR